jgi:hypothetical protein
VRDNEIVGSAGVGVGVGVGVKIKPDSSEFDKGGNSLVNNEFSEAPYAVQFNLLVPTGQTCGNVARTKELVFCNNTGDYGDGATPPDFTAPAERVGSRRRGQARHLPGAATELSHCRPFRWRASVIVSAKCGMCMARPARRARSWCGRRPVARRSAWPAHPGAVQGRVASGEL